MLPDIKGSGLYSALDELTKASQDNEDLQNAYAKPARSSLMPQAVKAMKDSKQWNSVTARKC